MKGQRWLIESFGLVVLVPASYSSLCSWGGIPAEGLISLSKSWVPQVLLPVCLLSIEAGGGQQILHSALVKDLYFFVDAAAACYFREGRLDLARSRDQEKTVLFCHCCFHLLFWELSSYASRETWI